MPGTRDDLAGIRRQFTRTADVYARMRQTTDTCALDALVAIGAAFVLVHASEA